MLDYICLSRVKAKEPKPLPSFEVLPDVTDRELLKFIHQEASVRVKDTITDHYEISKKIFSLLLLMVTISSFLLGFIIREYKNNGLSNFVVVSIVGFIICVFVLYVLSENSKPINFRAPGRAPKKVMVKKIHVDISQVNNEREKFLLYQEILHCQTQIDFNQFYNTHRLNVISFVFRLFWISFLVLTFLTILLFVTS